jgi:Fic family protein
VDWTQFIDVLGRAHRAVACFDQMIQTVSHPKSIFSLLTYEELLSSLEYSPVTLDTFLLHQALYSKIDNPFLKKILNYQKALSFASRQIKTKPISISFLCQMHQLIKPDLDLAKDKACFRQRQNWIGPEGCEMKDAYFYPPKFQLIPAYMNNLKHYLNSKTVDPLIQLSVFFAQLLVIHPFMDGNGRLARSLIPMILYKKKLTSTLQFYMSNYFKKHRLAYFEKLFLISAKGDWEEWIRFFLQGVIEEGENAVKKAGKILALYEKLKGLPKIELLFAAPILRKDQLPQQTFNALIKRKWIRPHSKIESIFIFPKLLKI